MPFSLLIASETDIPFIKVETPRVFPGHPAMNLQSVIISFSTSIMTFLEQVPLVLYSICFVILVLPSSLYSKFLYNPIGVYAPENSVR